MPTQVEKIRLLPPSEQNPRNSEGAFIQLNDGRLLFVYSHYYDGGHDHSGAYLAGRYSADGGRTWGEDVTVLENEGACNVMSVSLLRMADGDIGMLYLRKDDPQKLCRAFLRRSSDEAKSWSDPVLSTVRHTYNVVNNDRVIRLSSGRLLIPTAIHHPPDQVGAPYRPAVATCFLSDDDGWIWEHAATELQPPEESRTGLQEPCIIELRDGRVMMLCRTDMGCHYRAYSADGGVTWSEAEPTDLKTSCCSPASIRRIPQTGDILIVYNRDASDVSAEYEEVRSPLVTAISKDEGQTWEHHKWLEDDPGGWYCYTAIHFLEDEDSVVLAYCAGRRQGDDFGGLALTQITRIPLQWLYS